MLLEDRVALITGAGRGIGKAIALKFAEEGAKVVLTGRNAAVLGEVVREITQNGGDAFSVTGDLRDADQVASILKSVLEQYGRLDILVNNAGISKEMKLIHMPMEVWDEILEVNLRTVVLMTKAVLPIFKSQGGGNIINIASAAGLRGLPGSSAYSASKAAVLGLTQALGDELRPDKVRVNAICPGPVDTEMFQTSERRQFILDAGGDLFEPEDVANGALYLASDMSKGVSSQTLTLRGFNRW